MNPSFSFSQILLAVALVLVAMFLYHSRTQVERGRAVLDCVESMSRAAPDEIHESEDPYAAALVWCDDFLDRGGKQ